MPYTITTKDGITINGIPDDVKPDDPSLKARVEGIRAGRGGTAPTAAPVAAPVAPGMEPSHTPFMETAPSHAPTVAAQQPAQPQAPVPQEEPTTTAPGIAGAVTRGLGPYAASLAAGPQGPAVVAAAKLVGDPLTNGVNSLLDALGVPKQYHQTSPSQAIEMLMDKMGVAKPRTAVERVVQAGSEAAGSALGGTGIGTALAKSERPVVAGIGEALAAQPVQQVVGAATGGAASQATAEAGGGPGAQFGANLVGTLVGSHVARPRTALPAVAEPVPGVAVEPPTVAAPVVEPVAPKVPVPEMSSEDLVSVVKRASGNGLGATAARQQLAELAAINPAAKAEAERLGMDLPADIFSDNKQFISQVGLARSVPASEAEASFRQSVVNASEKADEVMRNFDANFVEGSVSPASVSDKVKAELLKTRNDLETQAKGIYQEVDNSIPKSSKVDLPKLRETLTEVQNEVGKSQFSAKERKLLAALEEKPAVVGGQTWRDYVTKNMADAMRTEGSHGKAMTKLSQDWAALKSSAGNMTYGGLLRLKNEIGGALKMGQPWGDLDNASLKRLYGALAEDQLTAVETLGSTELRDKLRMANGLTAQQKALGKRIVSVFGEDFNGSLAFKMRDAIKGAASGDSKNFGLILKTVPQDLQKEAIATALASVTRSNAATSIVRGGFGFSEFADVYRGLRANPEVYSQIVKALGPESDQILRDLYGVSKRITTARANVLTTGKALYGSENLMAKVLGGTVSKAAATAGAALGGAPLAGATSLLADALTNGGTPPLVKAGRLFASEEFQKLAVEAATRPNVNPRTIESVVSSPQYQAYAKASGAPRDPNEGFRWLLNAIRGQQASNQVEGEKR